MLSRMSTSTSTHVNYFDAQFIRLDPAHSMEWNGVRAIYPFLLLLPLLIVTRRQTQVFGLQVAEKNESEREREIIVVVLRLLEFALSKYLCGAVESCECADCRPPPCNMQTAQSGNNWNKPRDKLVGKSTISGRS